MTRIVRLQLLKLLCIDEIHEFVDFGHSFCHDFFELKNKVLQNIKIDINHSVVPILLMTATFNKDLLHLLQQMIGFNISNSNTFWAPIKSFNKQHINIDITHTKQPYNLMKKCQISKLKHNPKFKAIAIINTAQKACLCQNSLDQ